jgi:hypothetical protein
MQDLTEEEADAIALMWDGPRDTGDRLWYGIAIGTPMAALAGPARSSSDSSMPSTG